jgi:hypothetical protein
MKCILPLGIAIMLVLTAPSANAQKKNAADQQKRRIVILSIVER